MLEDTKGLPGGIAALNLDGDVVNGRGEVVDRPTKVLGGRRVRWGEKPPVPGTNDPKYLGLYSSLSSLGGDELASLALRTTQMGRAPAIAHHYYGIGANTGPGAKEQAAVAAGSFPMMSVGLEALSLINSGSIDDWIIAFAQRCAKFGWAMFVRIGWEMNAKTFSWSGALNGANVTITGLTTANPGVFVVTGHPFVTGETVTVSGVGGASEANVTGQVVVVDANHVSLKVSGTALQITGTYTAGGSMTSSHPAAFVAAFERFVNFFRLYGANNVSFVECFQGNSSPGGVVLTDPNNWVHYLSELADWWGIDQYCWGNSPGGAWQSMKNSGGPLISDWIAGFRGFPGGASKPMMVCEVGCYPTPGNVPFWWTDTFGYFKMSNVQAVVPFDTDTSSTGYTWNLDHTTGTLTAFLEAAADPWWGGPVTTKGLAGRTATVNTAPLLYLLSKNGLNDLGSTSNTAVAAGAGTANLGCPAPAPGLGRGFSCEGTNTYLAITTGSAFGPALENGFTLSIWFKVGSASGSTPTSWLIGSTNTGSVTGIGILLNCKKDITTNAAGFTAFWLRFEDGTSRACDINDTALYDGLWHRLDWVFQPSQTADAITADGQPVTLNSSNNATSTGKTMAALGQTLAIGARNHAGTIDNYSNVAFTEASFCVPQLTPTQLASRYALQTT